MSKILHGRIFGPGILHIFCMDMRCFLEKITQLTNFKSGPALFLSLRWPLEEEFRYCNSTQKNDCTVSLHFYSLSSFFPFDLPLPTSKLLIVRSGFLVPGPTGFNHVVHADDRDADYIVGGVE